MANSNFTTHGKEKELRAVFTWETGSRSLNLIYKDDLISVPTILTEQLQQLYNEYKKLGQVRFFCKSGRDKQEKSCEVLENEKPEKGKKKKINNTASKAVVLRKTLKKIIAIRMDIYISKKIFNEVDSTYCNKIKELENIRKLI